MFRFLRYFIIVIQISSLISAQQINKVIISGIGGQHDVDVKNAFLIGYSSCNGNYFTGDILLYANSLQASFEYAAANDYDLMVRSTSGISYGIILAPDYPSVKLVMPAGSNSYIEAFSGDVINSPVVITGAGIDSNQTAYQIEFYSIDPISESNTSSYSNGYIAGQLAFIANTLNCSFDSARSLARANGSEKGKWDFYNGFGEIETAKIIADPLLVELPYSTPVSLELKQNYPNPFNPNTTISFTIPESDNVSLNIYNSIGEEVANIVNEYLESGTYSFDFNAGILPSGVYVYRLNTTQNTLMKKMLLLK